MNLSITLYKVIKPQGRNQEEERNRELARNSQKTVNKLEISNTYQKTSLTASKLNDLLKS